MYENLRSTSCEISHKTYYNLLTKTVTTEADNTPSCKFKKQSCLQPPELHFIPVPHHRAPGRHEEHY